MKKTAAALVAVLAIAACSGQSAEETTTTAGQPTTTAGPAATTTTVGAGDAIGVSDTGLGTVVVDPDGNTLYIFTNDTDSTSTCYDACADNWPAVPAGMTAGDGFTGDLGETTRDDGSAQLTIDGRPVYYFAGDSAPGDTNGQGVGGVWFAIGADGEPISG